MQVNMQYNQGYAMSIRNNKDLTADVINRIESSDRIILPVNYLELLINSNASTPYTFEIYNPASYISMVVGVEQFSNDPLIYFPTWIMQQLDLQSGQIIKFKSVNLSLGKFAKFKADSTKFDHIQDKEAFLEASLKNFTVLNVGDTIPLKYGSDKFRLEVLNLKPADSVLIINTDLEFDFEPSEETKFLERQRTLQEAEERQRLEFLRQESLRNQPKFHFSNSQAANLKPITTNLQSLNFGSVQRQVPTKPTSFVPFSGIGNTLSSFINGNIVTGTSRLLLQQPIQNVIDNNTITYEEEEKDLY